MYTMQATWVVQGAQYLVGYTTHDSSPFSVLLVLHT